MSSYGRSTPYQQQHPLSSNHSQFTTSGAEARAGGESVVGHGSQFGGGEPDRFLNQARNISITDSDRQVSPFRTVSSLSYGGRAVEGQRFRSYVNEGVLLAQADTCSRSFVGRI